MPEHPGQYRLPNPSFAGAAFGDTRRTVAVGNGVRAVWGQLQSSSQWKVAEFLFDREEWDTRLSCSDWVAEHHDEYTTLGPTVVRSECFATHFAPRPTGTAPTDDELAAIQQYALEPVTADQLYVRTMLLSNDQWGKHNIRLSRGFQKTLIESTPGKSLMMGHPAFLGTPGAPLGKFFAAEEYRDEDGVTWNRAKFYIRKTADNEHARAQIDAGVWQFVSIGMETDWHQCSICGNPILDERCTHVPGRSYPREDVARLEDFELAPEPDPDQPDNVLCGVILRGRGRALEGSIVYLPELNGTEIVAASAALAGDFGRAKALRAGEPDEALAATTYADLPLADEEQTWSGSAARARVKAWAGGDDIDWDKYGKAHFWVDPAKREQAGGYKLPFADIIDGKLTAVWGGVSGAMAALNGSRGGVDIPDADRAGVYRHIGRYYKKFGKQQPDLSTASVDADRIVYHHGEPEWLAALLSDDPEALFLAETASGEDEGPAATDHPREGEDDMSAEAMQALEAEKTALQEQLAAATEQQATLTAQVAEFEKALAQKATEAEALGATTGAFRAAVVAELDRLAALIDRTADMAVFREMAGEDLAGLGAEKLLGLQVAWAEQFDKLHPVGGRQSTPEERSEDAMAEQSGPSCTAASPWL